MKDRMPTVLSILLLATLVVGTWIAAEYTRRAVPIDSPSRVTHEPDMWAKNITNVRTNDEGIAVHRLEGDYLEHFPDDDSHVVQRPRAFNLQPNAPVLAATSDMATILDDGDRIVMQDDAVVIRVGDGEHEPLNITSDELVLLSEEDVVHTDLPAVAIRGMSRLSGVGMNYDNKTRELNVYGASDLEISPRNQTEEESVQ